MAENPSNGHAPDGQPIHTNGAPVQAQPAMPRVAAPEGVRSARAFDGSPMADETRENSAETAQTVAFDDALESDLRASLAHQSNGQTNGQSNGRAPDLREIESAPPLGISIEKVGPDEMVEPEEADSTNGFAAYAPENFRESDDDPDPYRNNDLAAAGMGAIGSDVIEGEQLFADDGAGGDNGDPPSNDTALAASGGNGRPDTPKDQEQGLFEHLAELRSRLIYAIVGVMVVMFFTWGQTYKLQDWFARPIKAVLESNGIKKGELVLLGAPDAFTFYFQFSLTSALIIAMPWVLFQVWRFIEPALTHSERRYTLILVPFSSVLFFLGAGLGYLCSPLFFSFFLQFNPPGVLAQWKYDDSVILMAKMLLIFGLAFQVPIIIIFGNKIGLLSRNLLIEYWRHAVVVIFIAVAVLTPTWDPFTMTACALPPCLLYLLSIWLVKWL